MRRLNSKPKDRRAFRCPQCDKPRMIRDIDHVVSQEKQEYKTRDGDQIQLFVDICESCKTRNWTRHFEPSKADIKRVLKAMQGQVKLEENQSIEDLL